LSERIHCDEIIVTCNECRIKYIYIYIKCGDVSDACARLQKCEDEEEEILFFAEWRAIKFGGGSVLTRRRRRRRSVFAKFFLFFLLFPRESKQSGRRMSEIAIDLVSPMMSLDHHQHFVLENKIFESVSLHYTPHTHKHTYTQTLLRARLPTFSEER